VRIGFTYDLRDDYLRQGYSEEDTAELDAAETIDAIEAALRSLGHAVDRIGGVKPLAARLTAGDRWDLVFNYAEGLFGFAREAQVPALLDAFQVPYTFSDGLVFALTLHKGLTKHVVRGLGLPTPDFAVVSSADEVERVRLTYPLFVKPVAAGSSIGISSASYVAGPAALAAACERIIERYRQPALVETYLPGRELTVGISGTGGRASVLGVMEVLFTADAEAHGYSYANKKLVHAQYRIVNDAAAAAAADIALGAWTGLGCRDGGRVDCRCDATGRPQFLEVNPLAGLHPVLGDLVILAGLVGVGYEALIGSIVASATARLAISHGTAAGPAPARVPNTPPNAR
jgi:D-alanine-D-alanine ligase